MNTDRKKSKLTGTPLAVQCLKTFPYSAGGVGSMPGGGAKIPYASLPSNQNIHNRSNLVTNLIKALKMGGKVK